MAQLLFNPNGTDGKKERKAFKGNTTNLINLNNVRYKWAIQLWKQMRENFWVAEKVDLTQDIVDYSNLTVGEKRAFNGTLAFLVFLDSIQVSNLPNLKKNITAPEIKLCLAEQESQEGLHAQSYQYIIESVIPVDERENIYQFWRKDKVLKNRCTLIAETFQKYINSPSEYNYFKALVADYVLEGLFFYQGFCFFYTLASRMLMSGCADTFKYINRDELSHVRLYQKILEEAMQTLPFSISWIYEFVEQATAEEIRWNQHIIGDNVLGITCQSIEQYTKHLANIRLKAIGLEPLYENVSNPYKHLEKFADTKKDAHTKTNFFEATVTSYGMSTGITGWEEI